ncbi:hybrid sensor histidine kinase/response regulator [Orrella sp. JC864]|uniref:hybrid sensor histidine kinase/response regulator n=1 Tax=Orrella sp. JC864 TaxID=3120298 RepID=UPI0012BCF021
MKINVLVVDDVAQNLTAIEALLARPDITVLKADSGTAALELLLTHEVALALIDVQMPGMDGFELANLIRGSDRTRNTPLIFLTAASREQQTSFRGYEAGAVDFLYKPIDRQVLLSKVNVFVELYTQRKQLASQLEALQQSLHINEMFAAVLGHDLRNPLSAITSGAGLLRRLSDDAKVQSIAQRMEASAQRMARMVDQLLDVARIRSNGLALRLQQTDYAELCRGIVDELVSASPDRQVQLEVRDDVRGRADVDRLSQVISNLVGNALQHGEPGHPVQLCVDGGRPERITIIVQNQGVIPESHMPHLFEPFRAGVDGLSREGLGLGLYIVKQFVDAHGGKVTARSDARTGTVFELALPR